MDAGIATVIGALVTAIGGAIVAIIVARANKTKRGGPKDGPIADIIGVWEALGQGNEDVLEIKSQSGRLIEGVRRYTGADRTRRVYHLTGYFDGMVLALAATSQDAGETRTLALALRRISGTKFSGVRAYLGKDRIVCATEREWARKI